MQRFFIFFFMLNLLHLPLGRTQSVCENPPASLATTPGSKQLTSCDLPNSKTLYYTDSDGNSRYACLLIPKGSTNKKLPLMVYLHASEVQTTSLKATGFYTSYTTTNLTNDSSRVGYIILAPAGRDTTHYYPKPNDTGYGWDNWYRNFERGTDRLNVDVAAIDSFIKQVTKQNIVDTDRIYMTGWSNGAAMAQLYALNTSLIAATAVYSSPNPFDDITEPCTSGPFATNPTPILSVYRSCDYVGICPTSLNFSKELKAKFPKLSQKFIMINGLQQTTNKCVSSCNDPYNSPALAKTNHATWPDRYTETMHNFLRQNPKSK